MQERVVGREKGKCVAKWKLRGEGGVHEIYIYRCVGLPHGLGHGMRLFHVLEAMCGRKL